MRRAFSVYGDRGLLWETSGDGWWRCGHNRVNVLPATGVYTSKKASDRHVTRKGPAAGQPEPRAEVAAGPAPFLAKPRDELIRVLDHILVFFSNF